MTHEEYIRAGSPQTAAAELEILSAHETYKIRRRVAENNNTPVNILLILAEDSHPEVRATVADHNLTPKEVLERLAADECLEVRYTLAENANLPMEILLKLAEDENPYVSHRAYRTIRLLQSPDIRELGPNPYSGDDGSYTLRRLPFSN